jgi:hypothetical protein
LKNKTMSRTQSLDYIADISANILMIMSSVDIKFERRENNWSMKNVPLAMQSVVCCSVRLDS